MTKAQELANRRERYHNRTEEQKEDRREQDRFFTYKSRREKGIPERKFKKSRGVERMDDAKVPAEAFIEWLKVKLDQRGSIKELSKVTGISDRRLRTLFAGSYSQKGKTYEIKNLSIDFVDDALIKEGSTMLWELGYD